MPSAVGDSWDCCDGLETPHQGAAAAAASGGCSGEACLGTSVGAHHPLPPLHLAVVALALVRLVLAGVEVLLVLQCFHQALHLVLDAHPSYFAAAAAAASASDAGAFAVALPLLVTWSWGSLAAGLAVLAHPVVLLAVAGDPLRLHHQAGVGKMGVFLVVPGQAA